MFEKQINKESNPFDLFLSWLEEAKLKEINNYNAMCLSTVSDENKPSSRMVLLKAFDETSFNFFTNLGSKKSLDIKKNPFVSLCFYWKSLGKQIRIEGKAYQMDDSEADHYFLSRPRDSKIGAWASKQSTVLDSFDKFKNEFEEMSDYFETHELSRPDFWSGYKVKANYIEFWQEGDFRLHERVVFEKKDSEWNSFRLYP